MSDELPGGYISLENEDGSAVAREPEPEPAAEPAAEPEAAVEPATEPEAPTEEDDDAEPADMLTDGTGRRYVPVSALQREREARKELKRQLAQPRGLSAEEQKQLDSARYIAQQLKGRPDIIEALQSGQRLTREQQRTVERVEEKAGAPIAQPVSASSTAERRSWPMRAWRHCFSAIRTTLQSVRSSASRRWPQRWAYRPTKPARCCVNWQKQTRR
jgi:hypothetical protein